MRIRDNNLNMTNFTIKKYNKNFYDDWNEFVSISKNGTFLFHRDFMEYHKDRFEDLSLLLYKKDKLIALFPAHKADDTIYSHQGLSYGGMLLHKKCSFKDHCNLYYHLTKYLYQQKIATLYIKDIPLIYYQNPSEENKLLFFWLKATLTKTSIYSYLEISSKPQPNRNRQRAIRKAQENNIEIKQTNDYETFWNTILIPNLKNRFNATPTHTIDEIKYLSKQFPNHIKLVAAYKKNTMKAAAVLFLTEYVAHFQYSSGVEDRAENGALDLLFHTIMNQYGEKKYISLGNSSNLENNTINEGLLYWKESYNSQHITQRFYKIETKNFNYLEKRFT